MKQVSENYSFAPLEVQNFIANKIAILDKYIMFQTNDNEYTALVYNPNTEDCQKYVVTIVDGLYSLSVDTSEFDYDINNEVYTYSNIGYGQSLDLPVTDGVTSYSVIVICFILMFAVVFKGALFKCLKRKRR